jgi:phage N-6-adenine-methyltransferase
MATITRSTHSARDNWRTPPAWFAKFSQQFGPFDVDAAAEAHNALCPVWLGPGSPVAEDALAIPWAGLGRRVLSRVFLNPPYSRAYAFVEKARDEARAGHATTTLLLPATTDTRWFHHFVYDAPCWHWYPGVEVRFIQGRVGFLRPDGSTPEHGPNFGSVLVRFLAA